MGVVIIILVAVYYIYKIYTFEADYIEIEKIEEEKICIGEFGFTSAQKVRHIGSIIILSVLMFFIVIGVLYINVTLSNILIGFYLAIMLGEFVPIMYMLKWQYLVLTESKVIGKYKVGILGTNTVDVTLEKLTDTSIESTSTGKNIALSIDEIKKVKFLNILNAEEFKEEVDKAIYLKNNNCSISKNSKKGESIEEKLQALEMLKEKKSITDEEYYIKRGIILNNI